MQSMYSVKYEMLGTALARRTYRVMTDLEDNTTFKLLSWLRFCEATEAGEIELLYKYKAADQKEQQDQYGEDSDEDNQQWRAENINVLSVANERKMWLRLKQMCEDALKQYPSKLEQDMEILLSDDEGKQTLTFN